MGRVERLALTWAWGMINNTKFTALMKIKITLFYKNMITF